MTTSGFPTSVRQSLHDYVYRLIDPRNGETFYVGRGKGDRVFHHAKGVASPRRATRTAIPRTKPN